MRDNSIRENQQAGFINVQHCDGKRNLSDMFTKEDKDIGHYLDTRDHVVTHPLSL